MDWNLKKDVLIIILLLALIIVLIYLLWSEVPYWRHCLSVVRSYTFKGWFL